MLKNFKGFLQTDGYAAYDQFAANKHITTLCCIAHAHRYFVEAESNDKQRATHALLAFQDIYEQERQMKELLPDERQKLRAEILGPKLNALHQWMQEEYPRVTPKSPIGKAIAYSMKRWRELTEFINDGLLEIDNNKIENEIRPIALGRKNFLFAGSHESAQRIAMIYSLLGLTKVLEELPKRKVNNIEDLLPIKK